MFDPKMFEASSSATGSPASAAGRSRSVSLDSRPPPRRGPEVLPVRTAQLPLPCMDVESDSKAPAPGSRGSGSSSSKPVRRRTSTSKTCSESRRGLPKSREVWRVLATTWPNPNDRLRVLVRLISAGECGLLPTVVARDYRSPGDPNHPRQFATRGQPLPEDIGLRIPADFARWMMGFPSEWAACMPTAMRSIRGSRRRS